METGKPARIRLDKVWDKDGDGDIMTATFVAFDVEGKRLGPVAGVESLVFDLNDLNTANRHAAMQHGIEQKIGDAAALGQTATVEEKFAAMAEVAARLVGEQGQWNAKAIRGPQSAEALLAKLQALGFDTSGVKRNVGSAL